MTTALRPLSTGELLDRTFSLYRSHFVLFVGIFALPHLLVLAFQFVGVAMRPPGTQLADIMVLGAWAWGAIFLSMILSAVSQAATVVAVSNVHLGRPAGIGDSFSQVKGQVFGVIGVSLLVSIAAGAALLALLVPGIVLLLMWSLAIPAKILENKGVFDAMSRSMDLTKGQRGRIFVIWLLFVMLSFGMNWLLQWPILLGAAASGRTGLHAPAGWQVASQTATFISQCLVGPLATIAFSLVYYDQRVRKEAFDLQLMMMTLDAAASPSAPAQVGA